MSKTAKRRNPDGSKVRKSDKYIRVGPNGDGSRDIGVVKRLTDKEYTALNNVTKYLYGSQMTVPYLMAEAMELGLKQLLDRASEMLDREKSEQQKQENTE